MPTLHQRQMNAPERQGLYDPAYEHDACGIGFVAHAHGARSRDVVDKALRLLENLSHRSAVGADPETGDGAGILIQVPHAFLWRECASQGMALPDAGSYGVGMLFMPRDPDACRWYEAEIARCVGDEGCRVIGWRDVPVRDEFAGEAARCARPSIRQLFVARAGLQREVEDSVAFERTLYRIRKRIECVAAVRRESDATCYVASLSSRTIVYKGMLRPTQLARFYPDLGDVALASGLAVVHSRFSTNTFPSWPLAHPYRFICHNGEINTVRGNVNWMRVRESTMSSERLGADVDTLFPIVAPHQSDSASLDNVLELLVMAGRPLSHAMAMLIPEAWEGDATMAEDRRAFYEFHASLMEPWDGPAAIVFTDGRQIGALLDRNGLRPARYVLTDDDLVILASEAGALDIPAGSIRAKGRLRPGKMLLVNTTQGRVLDDDEIKAELVSLRPYKRWVAENAVSIPRALAQEVMPAPIQELVPAPIQELVPGRLRIPQLRRLQRAFGYTREELSMVLAPMATTGEEAVGSMGNDAPLAVLSEQPRLLFSYFRQLFAQVTNPAIDPIREQLVMSLRVQLGPQGNLLDETPEHARQLRLDHPVLTNEQLAELEALGAPLEPVKLGTLFRVARGPQAMLDALDRLCASAASAVRSGHGILILSDRGVDAEHASLPSLLAVSAVHQHLVRERLRSRTSLVVESGEAREVAHFALLCAHGASAVNPYLALETVSALGAEAAAAREAYIKAVGKGLLKVLSKMGISTLRSYCGAQICEAVGLDAAFVDRWFTGTATRLGGVGMDEIARETLARHAAAFAGDDRVHQLDVGSDYHVRSGGEHHQWNPMTIAKLQHATRSGSYATFKDFSRAADEGARSFTIRGLLDFVEGRAVPLDEVEPASEIVKRFVTGAMSFGSLSREAHETLAIAMNRIGARSNTGEGGEERGRFGTERNSAVKQVASARFGVTTEYLVNAGELQIKIAQGAKPGEGGQLPGHKVDAVIASTRCSTPGVTLISPPPHHDIYSIEDLAQLIHDLRSVNPRAAISVKLVAEAGVGTVAAGVAKAHADLIVISGDAGGTGASPLSSIKHAGVPWELGLAEAQQTLLLSGLRGRVRLQTDGQLKTGRDVVIAALLGADEFGFGTAPLIVEGCIMMRKCHLNTCPVGVATQDPVLRARFAGKPEHVVNYFFFVAEEVREIMARMGVRAMSELIGRTELLRARPIEHGRKARGLDVSPLLHVPEAVRTSNAARRFVSNHGHAAGDALDRELIERARPALDRREKVRFTAPVSNVNRAVGTVLAGEIARQFGADGLPDDTISIRLEGSAGQSLGAFAARGMSLELIGEANDYVGKGLSGGRIVIRAPHGVKFLPEQAVIAGNTVLYGATSGEAFIGGLVGERFAVRNSGATAVVEGVGDHGCEYMTGGAVVVLGRTGRNFAAGMSGGMAFVLDESGDLDRVVNRSLVELGPVTRAEDRALLRHLIEQHAHYTGSARARVLLSRWDHALKHFVRVIPQEYRRIVEAPVEQESARHG